MQIVFQDPYVSLNPRLSVGASVAEPLEIDGSLGRSAIRDRVRGLLETVGLVPGAADRRPAELSGGERQRVAIARALALEPRLLVLDEPLSSLDAATAAQIAGVLSELRASRDLAYLLISHDLGAVRGLAQRVAVMAEGRIVEEGATERVFRAPAASAHRGPPRRRSELLGAPVILAGRDAPRVGLGQTQQRRRVGRDRRLGVDRREKGLAGLLDQIHVVGAHRLVLVRLMTRGF